MVSQSLEDPMTTATSGLDSFAIIIYSLVIENKAHCTPDSGVKPRSESFSIHNSVRLTAQ
ncbi:hypothetical protein BLIG_00121 [Bifidobacterium longum subsp. infantis CCUG 52486]|uniref:Uncharacterized protein n=1 Tax=Bifidobacterium longum subsp. infantis CCUG 52486 TaxID=537937 RepID=C5E828_BIFLI|nr:hypothetical protein BLIG_00121 [Bifidobacterium longum subsp. infantis CCUG 52486]